jgi:hypothetical protein
MKLISTSKNNGLFNTKLAILWLATIKLGKHMQQIHLGTGQQMMTTASPERSKVHKVSPMLALTF